MADKMRMAVFDDAAFYPFRNLVKGPLSRLDDLESIEELLRAVVLQSGGSVVCKGRFAQRAVKTASAFPERLFQTLDADWQEFGHRVSQGKLGLSVPPVLAIVLTRSANREAIPDIVRALCEGWATARSKVWSLVDRLKVAWTVAEANEIDRELAGACRHFSPVREEYWSSPLRILWEFFVAGIGAAIIAGIAGGDVRIGAATGLIPRAATTVERDADLGRVLFGRGAFDLARRVRRETARIEIHALGNVLSESERKALGL